ncbi:MAG: DUF3304 domain-containing protein [Ralstonia sp.]|uniref:DUF3304 domain-containing protein n=2 Tax=Ralstonia TaxID=48736 RepID=A0A9Q2C506_RALPI|nr:DUF3304 domain-containing protein [Ralstonia pickettii]MBA9848450.1 DUF3304 domain-containing protein [Ralstonia pickettii]MBA9853913.1 DUF3304 domain-containing protein [Ralstonia pickettii]MBA9879893.1 DUF3304 domain-containing protein [Ralstonia pickettii]MBA9884872.1 DUF3304 domain-containing protein [Ralstonia pickettii]MBA9889903.1 DUF3304 domain-containing protein [Ralstonia pickettii]
MKTQSIRALLLISLAFLAGCDDRAAMAARDDGDPMQYGGVSGLNYTPYYIHTFNVKGHDDNGISGGGPNIMPATPDNMPSGGGKETCCAAFPKKWRPGLKVTVRWIANKKLDGIAWGAWYKAEAEMPEYGPRAGALFAIFLPGDRVKLMVQDGNANGHNSLEVKPTDGDPYVATGTVDEELTRQDEERREKQRQMKIAREAELAREAEPRKQGETSQ